MNSFLSFKKCSKLKVLVRQAQTIGFLVCFLLALPLIPASARDVCITVLHTTDIHGQISGTADRKAESAGKGGLLRCATLIKQVREKEANVLLLDCGDLIQGSAESLLSRGRVMLKAAVELNYDALIPGNHEFDWGTENLRALYDEAGLPVLLCNGFSSAGIDPVFKQARPFLIRDFDGVRIAVIGLTTPHIPSWLMPCLLKDAAFKRSVPALRETMPQVRAQKPDIIIVAAHQGHREWGRDDAANEINSIARAFPDIDLILGGHSHQEVVSRDVNGIPYSQAGCHCKCVGKVQLVVDADKKTLKSMKLELLPADESVAPDPELKEKLGAAIEQAKQYLDQKIGSAAARHSSQSKFPGQSQIQTLVSAAIAEAVQADVVLHRTLTGYELYHGPIRMRDLWGIVPYENHIGVASLTLSELAAILKENCNYLGTKEFRGVYGLDYEIVKKAPKAFVVRNLRLSGRQLPEGGRVRVAVNSHDLASAGGRFPLLRELMERPSSELEEIELDTRAAVAAYITRHSPIDEGVRAGAIVVRQ